MSKETTQQIVKNLTQYIPEPPPPPRREQKTWQGLEVGRVLCNLQTMAQVEVVGCSNWGMMLSDGIHESYRWEDKEWRQHWEKVRKTKKKVDKAEGLN